MEADEGPREGALRELRGGDRPDRPGAGPLLRAWEHARVEQTGT
ncbi:hypothetical protein [Streptomyces sp. NPDC052721]